MFSITTGTIVRVILVLIAVAVLWAIRDVVALVFVCLIIAAALDPTIDFFERYRIPRAIGAIIIYSLLIATVSIVLILLAGPIVTEIRNLTLELPRYWADINASVNQMFQNSPVFFTGDRINTLKGGLDDLVSNLTRLASGNILPVISAFFGGLVTFMLALVIVFYFIIQEGSVKQFFSWVTPRQYKDEAVVIMEKIQAKLGLWLRGQLLLSFIIFIVTYVGLKLLGVQYALVLALLAGLFEVIPYLGPILSAVPAIFLTLVAPEWGGWLKASFVLALYALIQQAENNFIVPKVMAKTVGLNPLVVIISILIGAQIAGVVGAVIAVPVATGITVYLEEQGLKKPS